MQDPPPPNPYQQDHLLEGLAVENDPIAYIMSHPITTGIIVVSVIVFIAWYVQQNRNQS